MGEGLPSDGDRHPGHGALARSALATAFAASHFIQESHMPVAPTTAPD